MPTFHGGARLKLCVALAVVLTLGATSRSLAANNHDLTLTDCLRLAIDHNAQLKLASQQFLVAKGRALTLHAILYPTLNAQALTAPTTLYVQINQVLYSRATFPQLRISRLAQDEAVINYRQTLDDVVFQVRQAFATALGARKTNELVHASIAKQSGFVGSAQQLFEAGRIQKNEVMAVQVMQNNLAQEQVRAQLDGKQGLLALSTLLGVELPPDARLVGELDTAVPADLNADTLTADALRDRADLRLLESLRLTQEQEILVDQKNAFPIVGASSNSAFQPPALAGTSDFDLERNYDEPEVQRMNGNSQLPLSLYFTWVVFDGGAMAGLGASDRAQVESQEVAIDALRRSIPGEVTAALSAIRTERETLRALDALTPPAEVRHSADLDYQSGRIRQFDRTSLESAILLQEVAHLSSEMRLSLALAALDHALGHGLLTKPTLTPPPPP